MQDVIIQSFLGVRSSRPHTPIAGSRLFGKEGIKTALGIVLIRKLKVEKCKLCGNR